MQSDASLPSPGELRARFPASETANRLVQRTRAEIRDALRGRDPRVLVVVGPCSIHDADEAWEYADRLARVSEQTRDALIVVMRAYFEKPRTTVGWKGLVNDPLLDDSCRIEDGLALARAVLLVIHARGVPCGTEVLDPLVARYLEDLLSWAAVGARTSESQVHRALASSLDLPVGFKNGTDGRIETAADAVHAARAEHTFLGMDEAGRVTQVRAAGNPDVHVVLRGGRDATNHDASSVTRAAALVGEGPWVRPVMVDCSHDNSGKDHLRQVDACRSVMSQLEPGTPLLGVLLESHLEAGRQAWSPGARLARGVSITDACIGWSQTESLLGELAEATRSKARTRAGTLAPA